VDMDSPADEAGLRSGDIIAGVNNHIIKDAEDAMSAFGSVLVGEKFSIDVLRGKKELHLTLIAREAP
jgi:S1-C subfamily serine protease